METVKRVVTLVHMSLASNQQVPSTNKAPSFLTCVYLKIAVHLRYFPSSKGPISLLRVSWQHLPRGNILCMWNSRWRFYTFVHTRIHLYSPQNICLKLLLVFTVLHPDHIRRYPSILDYNLYIILLIST